MQKSSRQFAILAGEDIQHLSKSQPFRTEIKRLKQQLKDAKTPSDRYHAVAKVCGHFSILDSGWIEHLAEYWDCKGNVPLPTKPWIERPEMAAWLKQEKIQPSEETKNHKFVESVGSRYYDPDFGGSEMRTIPGSPKIWLKRTVLRDGDGTRYLTITVRLTPDLSAKWLQNFVHDSWRWAELQHTKGKRKPSVRALAFEILKSTGKKERWSINRWAEWLGQRMREQYGDPISPTTAKRYVRNYLSKGDAS